MVHSGVVQIPANSSKKCDIAQELAKPGKYPGIVEKYQQSISKLKKQTDLLEYKALEKYQQDAMK